MTHLTPGEFVDAAEGTIDAERLRHLDDCEACRRELVSLVRVMRDAGEGPVPEPSPLFWEHFSARVRDAVREEASRTSWRPQWLRGPALVPLSACAAVVLVVVATLPWFAPRTPNPSPMAVASPASAPAPAADDSAAADTEWQVLAELVGPLDWDTANAAGLSVSPGDAERAVSDLDDEERRELSRLIAGELARLKS